MAPSGSINTPAPFGAGSFGINWEDITQYDEFIHEAADPVGWPIDRVRGHIVIESQGNPNAVQQNNQNGWSFGLMQVVPFGIGWPGWHELVREKAGLPANAPAQKVRQALSDPRTNIRVGVAILESGFVTHGTLDAASSAFFTGTPDWFGRDTVNKVTGDQYKAALNGLIAEQAGDDTAPAAPKPEQVADPLHVMFGGHPAPVFFGHKQLNTLALYHYGVGHGTDSPFAHTGIDVDVDYGTPLHTPLGGKVLCVGENWSGDDMWGQGCGAFRDTGDHGPDHPSIGVGNITIMLDSGQKLTFGHCRQALVNAGDRVEAGEQVGTSGGMFGSHTHIDVAVSRPDLTGDPNSSYWLLDPVPALIAGGDGRVGNCPPFAPPAFDGTPVTIGTVTFNPQQRTVTVADGGANSRQFATTQSCETRPSLPPGERVDVLYWVRNQEVDDEDRWWVAADGARIWTGATVEKP